MRAPFELPVWTGVKQERRRLYAILLSTGVFTLMMPFVQQSDHFLAIGIGCISFLFVLVFVPGRWFFRPRPPIARNPSRPEIRSGGPRPRLRSQPPPAPIRGPLTYWPPREGPLPPLPPRPRR